MVRSFAVCHDFVDLCSVQTRASGGRCLRPFTDIVKRLTGRIWACTASCKVEYLDIGGESHANVVPRNESVRIEAIEGFAVVCDELGLEGGEAPGSAVHGVGVTWSKGVAGSIGEEAVVGF